MKSMGSERLNILTRTKVANAMAFLQGERALKYVVASLLLLASVLRVAVAIVLPPGYFFPDASEYVSLADNLIQTHTYGHGPGVPDALIPPGYPLFLASAYLLFGRSILAVRLSQAVLDTFTCLLVFFIAKKIYDRKVAIVSLLALVLYPVTIAWSAFHLTETLYTFLAAVFFLCLVKSLDSPTPLNIFLSGITFTLMLLTRELLVIFPFLILLGLFWAGFKFKRAAKYILIFSLGCAVLLVPWMARNYLSLHRLVFLTERTESLRHQSLGSAHALPSSQASLQGQEQRRVEELISGVRPFNDTSQIDVWNMDFMVQHPLLYLKMTCVRFQTFWLHPNGLNHLPNWPLKAAYVLGHLIFLALGSFGMFLAIREGRELTYPLILVFPYVTVVILALRRPQPRYPLPFVPYLFMFAVSGLFNVLSYLGQRQPQVV